MLLRRRNLATSLNRLVFPVLAASWLGGCGQSGDDPDGAAVAEQPVLECETQQYACTWGEVDPEIIARTKQIGAVALRYGVDASLEELKALLSDQPEVIYAEVLGTGVRYRLEGGRPAWVYPKDELAHHRSPVDSSGSAGEVNQFQPPIDGDVATHTFNSPLHAMSGVDLGKWMGLSNAHAQSKSDDRGIAAGEPGKGKRALVISPYEWEWRQLNQRGKAIGLDYTRVEHDGADIAKRLEEIRDYDQKKISEVRFVADYNRPGRLGDESGPPVAAKLPDQVQLQDFLHWDKYNVVLLLSHGTTVPCEAEVPMSGPGPEPSDTADNWCPFIWIGRAKQDSYFPYYGLELYQINDQNFRISRGLNRGEADHCMAAVKDWHVRVWSLIEKLKDTKNELTEKEAYDATPIPKTPGGQACIEVEQIELVGLGLWSDFFRIQYPNGLENMILFLAACMSATGDVLLNHFAQEGNKNVAVFGFKDTIDAGDGFGLVYDTVEMIDQGLDNKDILEKLKVTGRRQRLAGRTLAPEDGRLPEVPAEVVATEESKTHGRDIVMLVTPSGAELTNGGSVRVQPIASPRKPDELVLRPQIIGIEEREARDLELKVQVAGEAPPDETYDPYKAVGERVHRYDRDISLGRKFEEGEIVDLEVSVEFDSGFESKWTYENVRLTAADCSWSVSVSGHAPATGTFSGTTGYTKTSDEFFPPISLEEATLQGDDTHPRPEAPWLEINLTNVDLATIMQTDKVTGVSIAIPGIQPGQTGTFNRIWGALGTGPVSHDGNADYRRVAGLPGGQGVGKILSTNVTLTRNDEERVEGSFEGRFLNRQAFLKLGTYERAPVGVGIHTISGAAIHATGHFSITADGSCRANYGLRR